VPQGITHPFAGKYPRGGKATNLPLRTTSPNTPVVFGDLWKALQGRKDDKQDERVSKGTHRRRPDDPRDHLRAEDPTYTKPPEARKGKKLKPVANMALRWRLGLQPPRVEVLPPANPAPKEPLILVHCTRCGKLMDQGDMEARKWGYFCTKQHAEESSPFVVPVPRYVAVV
jgi:hypothetical protein